MTIRKKANRNRAVLQTREQGANAARLIQLGQDQTVGTEATETGFVSLECMRVAGAGYDQQSGSGPHATETLLQPF